jgi:hypothetical protein
MSISRRTERENHLWIDLPEPDSLTTSVARHIVSAIVAGDPSKADELANLLLTLERELANCQDPTVDAVIEEIDEMVEMAFLESEPYKDYLDVYRMTVNQRCRRASASLGPNSGAVPVPKALDRRALILMVVDPERRRRVH